MTLHLPSKVMNSSPFVGCYMVTMNISTWSGSLIIIQSALNILHLFWMAKKHEPIRVKSVQIQDFCCLWHKHHLPMLYNLWKLNVNIRSSNPFKFVTCIRHRFANVKFLISLYFYGGFGGCVSHSFYKLMFGCCRVGKFIHLQNLTFCIFFFIRWLKM